MTIINPVPFISEPGDNTEDGGEISSKFYAPNDLMDKYERVLRYGGSS